MLLRNRSARRATTVVETAVMAPLMLLMMLGFLQFGYWFLLKQTVSLAASRGARAALLPGSTMDDVNKAVKKAMGDLEDYTTTSNVNDLDDEDQTVWVKIDMSMDKKMFTGKLLGGGLLDISTKAVVFREGIDRHPGE